MKLFKNAFALLFISSLLFVSPVNIFAAHEPDCACVENIDSYNVYCAEGLAEAVALSAQIAKYTINICNDIIDAAPISINNVILTSENDYKLEFATVSPSNLNAHFINSTNSEISNLKISGTGRNLILPYGATNIKNNELTISSGAVAIETPYGGNINGLTIEGNTVIGNDARWAIYVNPNAGICDVTISNNVFNGSYRTVIITNDGNITITDNIFDIHFASVGSASTINFAGVAPDDITNVIITGNTFKNPQANDDTIKRVPISLQLNVNPSGFTISDNTFAHAKYGDTDLILGIKSQINASSIINHDKNNNNTFNVVASDGGLEFYYGEAKVEVKLNVTFLDALGAAITPTYKITDIDGVEVTPTSDDTYLLFPGEYFVVWTNLDGEIVKTNFTVATTDTVIDIPITVPTKTPTPIAPITPNQPSTGGNTNYSDSGKAAGASSVVSVFYENDNRPNTSNTTSTVVSPSSKTDNNITETITTDDTPLGNVTTSLYKDVPTSHWAYNAIKALSDKGIVTGFGHNDFKPTDNLTRAQFATMIFKAMDFKKGQIDKNFSDVKTPDWFFDSIDILSSIEVLNGFEDGSFKPNQNVTREQMAFVIYNVLQLKDIQLTPTHTNLPKDFDKVADYAKEAVKVLYQSGLITGVGDQIFVPQDIANRAQASVIVYNLLEAITKK